MSRDKQKKKMSKGKKILLAILLTILGLLIAAAVTLVIMINIGKSSLLDGNDTGLPITAPASAKIDGDYVIYNGHKYLRNKNISSTLLMGIDKRNENSNTEIYGEGGQADAIFLLALDTQTGKGTVFGISRDTMADINVYDTNGTFTGTKKMQLCLAYGYGNGKEESCKNMAVAVSRLFYGIPINSYAAIDLDGISILNDAVGGVTVTVPDDLSKFDPALTKGACVTLQGNQAETFIRSRDTSIGPDSNTFRLQRQQEYVNAYIPQAIAKTKEDISTPINIFNSVQDYANTNIDAPKVTYLASEFVQNGFSTEQMLTVPGEAKMGDKYAEYHINNEEFYEMILSVFYTRAD